MPASVLIVGAGPSGLVLALSLVQNGIPVRIIDKNLTHRVGQRGAGIQPRSLEMHHLLGTLPDIMKVSASMGIFTLYGPDGHTVIKSFPWSPYVEPTPACPYTNIAVLGQDSQEGIMRAHLAKVSCFVELGTELRGLEQSEDGILARLVHLAEDGQETEENARFQYLAGADGARSVVRKQLGLGFLGETKEDSLMLSGDIYIESPLNSEHVHVWGTPETKNFSLRPTGPHSKLFNFFTGGPELNISETEISRDALVEAFYDVTGRRDIVFGPLLWMSRYKANIRMVDQMGQGRAFLVGDAAHCHSPAGGQGMNSGVQDSFNLGWKLALVIKGLSPPTLLETYSEERLPVIAEMLDKTTQLFNRVLTTTADDSKEYEATWKRGGEFNQLGVNCRGSRIVVDDDEGGKDAVHASAYQAGADGGGVRPGDRAPDAPGLVDAQTPDVPVRLFDIFGTSYHTVLVFGGTDEEQKAVVKVVGVPKGCFRTVLVLPQGGGVAQIGLFDQVVEDCEGHAFTGYGIKGERLHVVIVRPDGTVGAIVHGVSGVERYVRGVFM